MHEDGHSHSHHSEQSEILHHEDIETTSTSSDGLLHCASANFLCTLEQKVDFALNVHKSSFKIEEVSFYRFDISHETPPPRPFILLTV